MALPKKYGGNVKKDMSGKFHPILEAVEMVVHIVLVKKS